MAYPTSLDSFPTLNDGDIAHGYHFNNIHTALVALQSALGTAPAGAYADVAARLTAITAAIPSAPVTSFFLMGA